MCGPNSPKFLPWGIHLAGNSCCKILVGIFIAHRHYRYTLMCCRNSVCHTYDHITVTEYAVIFLLIWQYHPGFPILKNLGKVLTGSPLVGTPNTGRTGKNCNFQSISCSILETIDSEP